MNSTRFYFDKIESMFCYYIKIMFTAVAGSDAFNIMNMYHVYAYRWVFAYVCSFIIILNDSAVQSMVAFYKIWHHLLSSLEPLDNLLWERLYVAFYWAPLVVVSSSVAFFSFPLLFGLFIRCSFRRSQFISSAGRSRIIMPNQLIIIIMIVMTVVFFSFSQMVKYT